MKARFSFAVSLLAGALGGFSARVPQQAASQQAVLSQATSLQEPDSKGSGAWFSAPPEEPDLVSEALRGLRAEAATMLVQGRASANLPAIFRFGPPGGGEPGTASFLPVTFELAGAPLVEELSEEQTELRLEVYLYLVDASHAVLAHRTERLTIPLEAWGEALWSSGLRFSTSIEVPPQIPPTTGYLSARCLVLEPERRLFAMGVHDFERADLEKRGDEAIPFRVVLPLASDWVTARSQRLAAASSADDGAELPSMARGALRPILAPGLGELVLELAPELWTRTGAMPLRVELRRTTEDEASASPATEIKAQVAERLDSSGPAVFARVTFELPPLDRGSFQLSVTLADEDSGSEITGAERSTDPLEVWVVDSDDVEQMRSGDAGVVTWPQVLRWDADLPSSERSSGRTETETKASGKALRKRYSDLLRRLSASSDLDGAVRELADLESSALEQGRDRMALRRAQRAVEVRAVRQERAIVLPLLAIRSRGYSLHRSDLRFADAGYQRETAIATSRLLRPEHPEEIRGAAADILASLALAVDDYGLWPEARRVLLAALEVDPKSEVPHELLSILYERVAHYEEALEHTSQLLALNAHQKPTRLRRAILLQHLGQIDQSAELLERLTEERADAHVSTVAFQQLAKLRLRQKGADAAVAVLKKALAKQPDSASLRLQLANYLDRAGRPDEAARAVERYREAPARAPSPRLLYSQPPSELGAKLEERVARTVRLYWSTLANAG